MLAVAAALTMMAPAIASASPLVSFDNLTTTSALGNPPFTLGWEFTVTRDMLATDLGLFDDSQNGLAESHDMGIFSSTGTLLRSATIAAGTGATLINQFRYVSIAPLYLNAGQTYRVGAVFTSGSDPNLFPGDPVNFATVPWITFNGSRFAGGSTLADPTASAGLDPAYFGPNINATAVPEPATLLLLGTGAVALLRRRAVK